jgi:hypothetical protein
MITSKIRTIIIALVASVSLIAATVAPAVSQAAAPTKVSPPKAKALCKTDNGFMVEEGSTQKTAIVIKAPDGTTIIKEVTFTCGSDGKWH